MLKFNHPKFAVTLPLSEHKVFFRPFTVKEEKILLFALEDGEEDNILDAIKQIITNCVVEENFPVMDLPLTDIEYLFLQMRSKSIGNMVTITLKEGDDTREFEIDLDEVKVVIPENFKTTVNIDDNSGIVFRYPTLKNMVDISKLKNITTYDGLVYMMASCIHKVWIGDEVQVAGQDFTLEEAKTFTEDLTKEQFSTLQGFFSNIPIVQHTINYTNKAGEAKSITLKGMTDFFR